MTKLQKYEDSASSAPSLSPDSVESVKFSFHAWRKSKINSIESSRAEWNEAVASAVLTVGSQNGLSARRMGSAWHQEVANALCELQVPLHSDVILSPKSPVLKNDFLSARLRAFGATFLSEDPEFMPSSQYEWPRFPYFSVEPGTSTSLQQEGLILFANPPGLEEDEDNSVGSAISSSTYGRSPMVSIEASVQSNFTGNAALLLNWSFRGRQGAKAKIFVDGLLDVPAFEISSTDDDPTPNFWSVIPCEPGQTVIDLKHVGTGFLFFEHCDVHHINW